MNINNINGIDIIVGDALEVLKDMEDNSSITII